MELTEDQVIGRDFLVNSERAILADEVGFGKTLQVLSAARVLGCRRILYVTGVQAAFQVEEEMNRLDPTYSARVLRAPKRARELAYTRPTDLLILGYETFRADVEKIAKQDWDLLVLDDASKFKNPESQLASAARTVSARVPRAWAVTATPIETSLVDLWSIFSCIGIYPMGSWEEFNEEFCVWGTEGLGSWAKPAIKSYKNIEVVRERIDGLILRRRSTQTPEVIYLIEKLGLTPEQLRTYHRARGGYFGGSIFDRFTRSLMACDSTAFQGRPWKSSKIDWIIQFLKLYEGKVVIYSQWKATMRHLEQDLLANGIEYVEISGDISMEKRVANQKRFKLDPLVKVCIVTKAGEQALNLQSAQILITLNRLANPQRMAQVHGRIARMGSKFKVVFVLDLVVGRSVEERMLALSDVRSKLFTDVLGKGLDPTRFSIGDMEAILKVTESQDPEVQNGVGNERIQQLFRGIMEGNSSKKV